MKVKDVIKEIGEFELNNIKYFIIKILKSVETFFLGLMGGFVSLAEDIKSFFKGIVRIIKIIYKPILKFLFLFLLIALIRFLITF